MEGGSFKPRFTLQSPCLLGSVHETPRIAFPSNPSSSSAAGSLTCYTCKTQLRNSNCQTETTCANNSQVCKTDVINVVGLFNVINKECATSCEPRYQDFTVGNQNVSCCSTNLCNRNGVGSVSSSYATMAVGLTTSVLCILLRNGL
uniref:UPAR/Ly6 domain-containing protein n=1 Tax=Gopherus agassizii TaxID=38772 RepID=A0A452IIQ1_9SAUR